MGKILTLRPKPNIELLAIEVPEEIAEPHFYRVNNESIMFKWTDVRRPLNPHDVVKVDYYRGDLELYKWPEFIATTKDITEEQARKIYDDDNVLVLAHDGVFSLLRFSGLDPDKKTYALLKLYPSPTTVNK